jgi:hypothetical protein
MTKIIIFVNDEGGISTISPGFGERLNVMSVMPGVESVVQAETETTAEFRSCIVHEAQYRPETDYELIERAAHCALPVGTLFATVAADAIPATPDDVEAWPFESVGRDAFEQAWREAGVAIFEAFELSVSNAKTSVAENNEACVANWLVDHAPPPPPAVEPPPAPDGEGGEESDGDEGGQ